MILILGLALIIFWAVILIPLGLGALGAVLIRFIMKTGWILFLIMGIIGIIGLIPIKSKQESSTIKKRKTIKEKREEAEKKYSEISGACFFIVIGLIWGMIILCQ